MTITSKKIWNWNSVREMCIRENFYTEGDCEEYDAMLTKVRENVPTDEMIYEIAIDINAHSEGQTVSNIMFILANDVVKTCYTLYDDNGNEIE